MHSSIALLASAAIGAFARASTSVVPLFLGGPVPSRQAWAGSVVSAGASDTVYAIVCTSGCGSTSVTVHDIQSAFPQRKGKQKLTDTQQQSITIGPSTLNYDFATDIGGQQVSASETCELAGTTSAICEITFSLSIAVPGQTTILTSSATTVTLTGSQASPGPVTITAGVEKLAAATGASGSGSHSSSASMSSSGAASGSAATPSSSGSVSASRVHDKRQPF
jgi:hypothetical protein